MTGLQKRHQVEIANDFGVVKWTPQHEAAFLLLADAAHTLEMTVGELADILANSERECPQCKAGKH